MKYFVLIIVSFFSSFSVAENSVEGKWEGIASNASGGIDYTYLAVDKDLGELIISYNLRDTDYCKFDMSSKREMRGVVQYDLLSCNGRPSKKPMIIELASELKYSYELKFIGLGSKGFRNTLHKALVHKTVAENDLVNIIRQIHQKKPLTKKSSR